MDVEGSDNDSEWFVRSAYPPVQLPLDYTQHQKKHRMVTRDVKVVPPNIKAEAPDTMEVKPDTLIVDRKPGDSFSVSGDRSPPLLVTSSDTSPTSLSASKVTAAEVFSHVDDPQAHMVLFQLPDTLPFTPGDQTERGGEGAEEGNDEEVRPPFGGKACNCDDVMPDS